MSSVTRHLDQVIDATGQLREIRNRLSTIEEERAGLESQAQRLLEQLAGAAASALRDERPRMLLDEAPQAIAPQGHVVRPASLTSLASTRSLTDKLLAFLAENPARQYGATEVAKALALTGESNVNTIRGTLSRLFAEGRISKAAYGKYMHKQEGKESGSPVSE